MLVILFIFAATLIWNMLSRLVVTSKGTIHLPPSPRGRLPVLGHLWRLHPTKPFQTIDRWAHQLGDVMTVYFGSEPVIVISKARLIREAFLKDGENFSGRPYLFVHESCWGRGHVLSDGPKNSALRRHIMGILRSRSRGPNNIQSLITKEIANMIQYVDDHSINGSTDLVMEDAIFYVIGNVMTQLVLGRSHPHGSEEFKESASWLQSTTLLMEKTAPLTFLPWLRHFPGGFGYYEMKKKAKEVQEMMTRDVEQRKLSNEYRNPENSDVTSLFLRSIDENENEILKDELTDGILTKIMTEMFFAGIQTECSTLSWAFLYFLFYPDEQIRCRNMIVESFGWEEEIKFENRDRCPFLEATVHEVQRLANIAPFGMPHKNHRETTLDGYTIPANSLIFMNLYSTLADPETFPDPSTFNPSRFLTADGHLNRSLMAKSTPYGTGPRICMGESIARNELFCVIGSLLRRYSFEKIPGEKYSLDQKMELIIQPDKYKLRIRRI